MDLLQQDKVQEDDNPNSGPLEDNTNEENTSCNENNNPETSCFENNTSDKKDVKTATVSSTITGENNSPQKSEDNPESSNLVKFVSESEKKQEDKHPDEVMRVIEEKQEDIQGDRLTDEVMGVEEKQEEVQEDRLPDEVMGVIEEKQAEIQGDRLPDEVMGVIEEKQDDRLPDEVMGMIEEKQEDRLPDEVMMRVIEEKQEEIQGDRLPDEVMGVIEEKQDDRLPDEVMGMIEEKQEDRLPDEVMGVIEEKEEDRLPDEVMTKEKQEEVLSSDDKELHKPFGFFLDSKKPSSDDDSVDSSSDSSSSSSSSAEDEMDEDEDNDEVELIKVPPGLGEKLVKVPPGLGEKQEESHENGKSKSLDFPTYRDKDDESSCESSSDSSSSSSASETEDRPTGADTKQPKFPPKGKDSDSEERISRPRVKGEIFPEELPALENLNVSVNDDVDLRVLGKITSVIKNIAVAQAEFSSPIDQDSMIFLKDRTCIGKIFDIIGPVRAPFYTILLDKKYTMLPLETEIYCAPEEKEFTKYVFVNDLKNLKGSDASWEHDVEPPLKFLDYSDDEKERQTRKKNKCKKPANEDSNDDPNDKNGKSQHKNRPGSSSTGTSNTRGWRKRDQNRGANSNLPLSAADASQQSMFACSNQWPPSSEQGSFTSWPPSNGQASFANWPPSNEQANFANWPSSNEQANFANWPPSNEQASFASWPPSNEQDSVTSWPQLPPPPLPHPRPNNPTFQEEYNRVNQMWPPNYPRPNSPADMMHPFRSPWNFHQRPPNMGPYPGALNYPQSGNPFVPPTPNHPWFQGPQRLPHGFQGPQRPQGSFGFMRNPSPRFSHPPQFPGIFP